MNLFIEESSSGAGKKTESQMCVHSEGTLRCSSPIASPLPTFPGAPSLTPFPSPEHLPRTFTPLTRARRSSFLSLESEAEPGREMF